MKHKQNKHIPQTYYQYYTGFFVCLSFALIILLAVTYVSIFTGGSKSFEPLDLTHYDQLSEEIVPVSARLASERDENCTHWDCFDVYKCGKQTHGHISVYVYPLQNYKNEYGAKIDYLSRQYFRLLKAIKESRYYTPNPHEACLFVPSLDILNQQKTLVDYAARVYESLPYWNNGANHLIFNMVPGQDPDFNTVTDIRTGRAIIAGAGFNTWTYRSNFDVSVPVYSSVASEHWRRNRLNRHYKRKHLIISAQINLFKDHVDDLRKMASSSEDIMLLEECLLKEGKNESVRCQYKTQAMFKYPEILRQGVFCLVLRGARLGQAALMEAMAAGCIPIMIADSIVMPFEGRIDWNKVVVSIPEESLPNMITIIKRLSSPRQAEMAFQGKWIFEKYFSSMKAVSRTTLDIINERAFPMFARSYEEWNLAESVYGPPSPLIQPLTAPRAPGFTAVILTYDRVESLYTLIRKMSKTPSLTKILVVWNNQKKAPPPSSEWPVVAKPVKVIQTSANKLSNRFYPYDEIDTECQLTIDDDIIMLTPDELEFGYDVWREFPDRIVGFPSRLHAWDNTSYGWRYQSEWTNEISMVLTGAAFHHKIWSWHYTHKLPKIIKKYVDDNFNCEDIAMNFLVANLTNKAPIKVAPRKKFKCPECSNNEMLSADLSHMTQRSACINYFTEIFGHMALRTVEFRADPVLYMDNFPEKLKFYNEVGNL